MRDFRESVGNAEPLTASGGDGVRNRFVSPCGRFERFDRNGLHFEIDWEELHPRGAGALQPEIPHEQVMAEMDRLLDDLEYDA